MSSRRDGYVRSLEKRFPEVAMFPDDVSAARAVRKAQGRFVKHPLLAGAFVLFLFGGFALMWTAGTWIPELERYAVGICLLACVVGSVVGRLVYERSVRRYLRVQLAKLGRPICEACGYDLRGQTEPRCPECGAAFDPRSLPSKSGGG